MRRAIAVSIFWAIGLLAEPAIAQNTAQTSPALPEPAAVPGEIAPASVPAAVGGCDRACLSGILDQYVAALVRHQPSAAPLASDVKFTENTVKIPVGEGLWLGVNEAPSLFHIRAIDLTAGQIGYYGLFKAWGAPALTAIRLKIQSGKITEAEHIVARQLRRAAMVNLVTPRSGLLDDAPPKERNSREALVRIANLYFDAIEQDRGDIAPFADECQRHENGIQTTTNKPPTTMPVEATPGSLAEAVLKIGLLGCKAGIDSGVLSYITRIQPRRPLVVDEQKGLVFAFPMFVSKGDVQTLEIKGVPGVDRIPASGLGASNLMAGEIFKIRNSRIYEIEGVGVQLPYLSPSGWDD